MSDPPGRCGHCGATLPTTAYVDRHGHPWRLCKPCLDVEVIVRGMEIKLELIEARLRAQSKQMARLERENEHLRDGLATMMGIRKEKG